MLTQTEVLNYIKNNLAIDITGIEFDDERILEIIRDTALLEFSIYVPDYNKVVIDPSDPTYQLDENTFRIIDPEGRRIIAVEKVIPPIGTYVFNHHPLFGVSSYNDLPDFYLDVDQSHTTRLHSMFDFSYEIEQPNIIRIYPRTGVLGPFTVVYSREHAKDFSTIPLMYAPQFKKMALGYVMKAIGYARTRFGSVSTPFGEINLNGDALLNDGKDLINEAKEELNTLTIPYIEIDRG